MLNMKAEKNLLMNNIDPFGMKQMKNGPFANTHKIIRQKPTDCGWKHPKSNKGQWKRKKVNLYIIT